MPVKPDIHLKYTSAIWNIYTSEDNFVLLELRNETSMDTYFDLFNIKTKKYQWQNFAPGEQWRIGISYFNEHFIVIHEFSDSTLPEIKKLAIYSTIDHKKINEIEDLQPHGFSDNIVMGTAPDGATIYLDLKTGKETDKNKFSFKDVMNPVLLPLTYKEETDNFVTVKEFVNRYFKKEAVGASEYLEYNDNIFLSFHTKEELLENWLVGLNEEGEVWLKEQIDKGNKLFSDTFFIWQSYLIFIVGKHELKAIKL